MKEIMLWKSHYYSGHDFCVLQDVNDRWELFGTALLTMDGAPSRLHYFVQCDGDWKTTAASVQGIVGLKEINIQIKVTKDRAWLINGQERAEFQGCSDIDLGFTPATNTLPIRRLSLAIGKSKPTSAAWLKVPDFSFSLLDQIYSRTTESDYLYESGNGRYSAVLPVNDAGFVTHYPELWTEESSI